MVEADGRVRGEGAVQRMHWAVAAPFFTPDPDGESNWRWLDDFVSGERHVFTKIGAQADRTHSWHARRFAVTPMQRWADYVQQTRTSYAMRPDGIITVFPQLAACVGARRLMCRSSQPLLAWCFNVGARPSAGARLGAKWALSAIDRFVVHSRAEIALLSEWFDIPESKIEFVHLQRAAIPVTRLEDVNRPYIVAMGSANRDYDTLIRAVAGTGIPTVIIAAPRLLSGLRIASNVTVLSGLSPKECREFAMGARLSVVPLADVEAASGQVTVIEAMRMGRPVVATRSAGTIDYITDGATGMLAEEGDDRHLRAILLELWENAEKRRSLAAQAALFAEQQLSDEAAARSLTRILDGLADARLGFA